MSHLPPERLLHLGLDCEEQLTTDEASHLARCPSCVAELTAERRLTESLMKIPLPEPSANFAAVTCSRFEQALAERRVHTAGLGLLLALGLGLLAAAMVIGLVLGNIVPLARGMAVTVEQIATLGHVAVTLGEKLPVLPVALVAIACAAALSLSTLLGRLALTTVEVK